MRTAKSDILWFDREDGRRVLRASVGTDQKLRLGEELRKALPPDIRLGFEVRTRTLILASGHGQGIFWPKNGAIHAKALCRQLRSLGLKLPLSFEFERDPATRFYRGRIVPPRQPDGSGAYDVEQMMVIYQPLIDSAVDQLAKSTPKPERRAIAAAAFFEAIQRYEPGMGEWEDYLKRSLHHSLLAENRPYAQSYRDLRLDLPFRRDGESSFSLQDVLADPAAGGIDQMESRIMAEAFFHSLTEQERRLVRLMEEEQGLKLPQIALELQLSQEDVIQLGREIGRKREQFYAIA